MQKAMIGGNTGRDRQTERRGVLQFLKIMCLSFELEKKKTKEEKEGLMGYISSSLMLLPPLNVKDTLGRKTFYSTL